MREHWSRALAVTIGAVVVVLALWVARVRNPPTPAPVAPGERVETGAAGAPPSRALGREVYLAQGCPRCHSIAGAGNPRSPLDGVGARRSASEIRERVIAAEPVRGELPPRAVAAKRRYAELRPAELDALVAYLASLGS